MHQERIPQPGRTAIIYLGPHHDRAIAMVQHFDKRITHFLREQRPIRLDESQVSDVLHKAARIGIENITRTSVSKAGVSIGTSSPQGLTKDRSDELNAGWKKPITDETAVVWNTSVEFGNKIAIDE